MCLNVHSWESLTLHHEINTTWQGFLAYEYHTTSYRIGRLLVCYIPHIKHTTPTDSCVWRACQLQRDRQITCVLYTIHQAHHTHYVHSTDFEWELHIVSLIIIIFRIRVFNVSLDPSNHITDLVWILRFIDFSFRCIIIVISPVYLIIIIIVVDIEINIVYYYPYHEQLLFIRRLHPHG